MAQTTCPVCGLAQVPASAETCPQCDADLTCFAALDALRTPQPTASQPQPQPQLRLRPVPRPSSTPVVLAGVAGLGGTLAVGLLALLVWRMWALDRLTEQLLLRIAVPVAATQAATAGSDPAATCTPPGPTVSTPTPAATTAQSTYRVQPGDTLWHIARRIYGSGRYYPVILTHNPKLEPNRLTAGDTLRVVSDLDDALRLYGEAILHRGGRDTRPAGRATEVRRHECRPSREKGV